jgi:anti-anti-sigma factor
VRFAQFEITVNVGSEPGRGASPPFQVRRVVGRDGYVVAPRGALDLGTCDELFAALEVALLSGSERVILDLRGLDFIDSSGLQAVLVADLIAVKRHKDFMVRRGPDSVQRVFDKAAAGHNLQMVD